MLGRGKGETMLWLLGPCGAAPREPERDVPMPPGKAPAWGKAAFPHGCISQEGKGSLALLETCRGNELVDGPELLLGQTLYNKPCCSLSAAWAQPSHRWSRSRHCCVCSSGQGCGKAGPTPVPCPPAAPSAPTAPAPHTGGTPACSSRAPHAPSRARNSLVVENLILPSLGSQGATARCPSGVCLGGCGWLLEPGQGSRCCTLLAAVSIQTDKYRPTPHTTPSLQKRFCKH